MNAIFVDTWAWYALTNKRDSGHQRAKAIINDIANQNTPLVTTSLVIYESVTLTRYDLGYPAAKKLRDTLNALVDADGLHVEFPRSDLETEAWAIFDKYADQDFSFVDCYSFAVMKHQKLVQAFTADHHYQIMGFILVS